MRVVIAGGGIGGLTLAQALVRAGDDVVVVERDRDPADTGGYRLHLDAAASTALRRALPPERYAAVRASSAGGDSFRQIAVTDHRLRVLFADPQDPDPGLEPLLVGRITLRLLLCTGLDECIRFGSTVVGFEPGPEGVVTSLADGGRLESDLLVAADGARSRVAETLTGHPTSREIGISGIAGRTFVRPADPAVPALLREGPALAFGPAGVGLFLTLHEPGPAAGPGRRTELVWGLIADTRRYPAEASRLDGPASVAVAVDLLRGWSPAVRALVAAAATETTGYFAFRAADPTADLTPWPPGRVTALGDAIHAMPPTGGQGAATAIRDADALASRLRAVRDGTAPLSEAIAEYHRDLAAYAPAAVAESLQPVAWIRALSRQPVATLSRALLPAAAGLAAATRSLRR